MLRLLVEDSCYKGGRKMLEKKIKKLKMWDLALVKLSVAAFVLFLITIWPAAMSWVHSVHWGWFLGITIIAAGIVQFRISK